MTFKMKKIALATSIVVSALMLQACNDTSIVALLKRSDNAQLFH
ncbi:hypothetical protein [Photobacterium indicum]